MEESSVTETSTKLESLVQDEDIAATAPTFGPNCESCRRPKQFSNVPLPRNRATKVNGVAAKGAAALYTRKGNCQVGIQRQHELERK